jgi:hypothetical protein
MKNNKIGSSANLERINKISEKINVYKIFYHIFSKSRIPSILKKFLNMNSLDQELEMLTNNLMKQLYKQKTNLT